MTAICICGDQLEMSLRWQHLSLPVLFPLLRSLSHVKWQSILSTLAFSEELHLPVLFHVFFSSIFFLHFLFPPYWRHLDSISNTRMVQMNSEVQIAQRIFFEDSKRTSSKFPWNILARPCVLKLCPTPLASSKLAPTPRPVPTDLDLTSFMAILFSFV